MDIIKAKRKRRSKEVLEGRIFVCVCGKSYFSQQALYSHKKSKHSDTLDPEELIKRKRGRPRLLKEDKNDENYPDTNSQDTHTDHFKVLKRKRKETCDEIFAEYLVKKQKTLEGEKFSEIQSMIYRLRECINSYSEKIDLDDFFYYESYTITEKADLLPNIAGFYINEYFPRKKPGYEAEKESGYLLEFFRWMRMKEYTQVDLNEFFNSE